ncbi:MAG: (E)-4-hydroxy-3-methylbut-2-enyl-diphosphate synthase [Bacteroidales bacterium]|nr:(E)-4-hydroxy-3-methylbut-2-enyl-diphosphate synthase [Bacteroidales bacterium]
MKFCSTIVNIGNLQMGGDLPVRLQSMTNTSTTDVDATVNQIIVIVKAGADLVRVSTPSLNDVKALAEIKKKLLKLGYSVPLVADIHFNPKVAEEAAKIVEKIRINPGNYSDRKNSETTPGGYDEALEKMRKNMLPLIRICKEYGTAIRVGVNAGSLSERIMMRYGNTPEGMVESALEFVRICEDENFHNLVISMKASNVKVMIDSSVLLQEKMQSLKYIYPQHLGVTEAGEGESGRIRSAIGISTLLSMGIGDTIRVSLSEPPEYEIPVAAKIVEFSKRNSINKCVFDNYANTPLIITPFEKEEKIDIPDSNIDLVCIDNLIYKLDTKSQSLELTDFIEISEKLKLEKFSSKKTDYLIYNAANSIPSCEEILELRKLCNKLIIKKQYSISNIEDFGIALACNFGNLLVFNKIDGLFIENKEIDNQSISKTILSLYQSSRRRISGNDYISCPTCSRTNFDLLNLLKEVKTATAKFKNLKIAVMGCIVNGPGEMADADYGCVGAGKDKVNIYKGKSCVKKNVALEKVSEELIKIIEENI